MTEWTLDLMLAAEPGEIGTREVGGEPDDAPYADLVVDSIVDDLELDNVDWLT